MPNDLALIDKGLECINDSNIFSLAPGSGWDIIGKYFDKLTDSQRKVAHDKIANKLNTYLSTNLAHNLFVPEIPAALLNRFKVEEVKSNNIEGSIGTFRYSVPKVKYPPCYKVKTSDFASKLQALARNGVEYLHLYDNKGNGALLENIDRLAHQCISIETSKEVKNLENK